MLPATATRVQDHTAEYINRDLLRQAELEVARHVGAGPGAIEDRLAELEKEWDIERVLQTNFATINLFGIAMGALVNRRWFLLPAVTGAFMLMHAIQGWCPPVPIFRRLGYRTELEIDRERYALKALRGDFDALDGEGDARQRAEAALRAVRGH